MKTQWKTVIALAACLVLFSLMILACVAVLSLGPKPSLVTREQYDLVHVGMTRAELESVLGRPRNEFRNPVIVWAPQRDGKAISAEISPGTPKLRFFPNAEIRDKGREIVWLGKSGLIAARFDESGRLREKYYSTVHDPGGPSGIWAFLAERAGPEEAR